ncbi:hypothetical protein SNEBB_007503 [Seison nebaliae]|nr:hypothetical protein SNEBB_007503 [Seison nebaliae]
MKMYFHGGIDDTILFNGWKCKTDVTFGLSCLLIVLIGVLYEGIKFLRRYIYNRHNRALKREQVDLIQQSYIRKQFDVHHLIQTLLLVVQFTIGYFLMLIAMTYNTYLFISVVIGVMLGYFITGVERRMEYVEDCCH